MERSSFLSSLPFLVPTCLSALPQSERERKVELLLGEPFRVSLEPESAESLRSRPAFFVNANDPAMATVEVALELGQYKTESDTGGKNLLLASPAPFSSLSLLLRVDRSVYVIDVRRLKGIQLQEEAVIVSEKGDKEERRIPPCLRLSFPSCTFRLFSTFHDQRSSEADYTQLEKMQQRITQLVQTHPVEVWKLGLDRSLEGLPIIDSPSVSTASTTHGQQNRESQSSSTGSDTRKRPSATAFLTPTGEEQDWRVSLGRRQRQYDDLRDCLVEVNRALTDPSSNFSNQRENEAVPQVSMSISVLNRLAAAVPELQSRSMISVGEISQASDALTASLNGINADISQVMEAAFPSRRNRAPGAISHVLSAEEAEAKVAGLLKDHKRILGERTQLLLLPSRE